MKKETKQNIALGIISSVLTIVVFIFLAEATFEKEYEQWKTDYAKDGDWYGKLITPSKNKKLMWEYNPNTSSDVPGLPTIATNNYGFRSSYDWEIKKEKEITRIAFIGDSVTLGYANPYQETFPYLLSEKIPNIESLNFGIDGYNTLQIEESLKSNVIPFSPDKVIYTMCLNDFDFEDSSGDKIKFFSPPKSFFYEKMETLYREYTNQEFHMWHFSKHKKDVFASITRMKNILKEKNIPFEVIILPVFQFWDEGEEFMGPEHFTKYRLTEMHAEINKFLKEQDISHTDMLPIFKATGKGPGEFSHDVWHLNAGGNKIVAEELSKIIKKVDDE